ncbi:MAG: hypothetical protein QF748_00920 [Candidatus Pacebacteria bacterium]|jgi:hypothetical protein|nr:hypothetical protein [Candidatus Paceibacterota bacterium]|tara:strand:- start:1571 stop:2404 length:834 start_codon:yes stop_codon:yes gene_type:complete
MVYGRKIKRSSRLTEQKREVFLVKSGLITLVLILIIAGLTYLSRLPQFHIVGATTEGNSVTSNSEIEKIINQNITGYYLGFFARKNVLIYPKKQIKRDLMEEFRRIEDVRFSIIDLEELHVVINERKPDTLWCGVKKGEELEEKCFFVDPDGLIYSKAPSFSGNVFLKVYGEIGGSNPIGREFLPKSKYQSLKSFKSSIKQLNLVPASLVKLREGDMELWLNDGARLIYNLEQDIVGLSEDLNSILSNPSFKKEVENKGILDYIDLRFGNKVYYQFK